jgi:hypothetical protein
MIIGIHVREKDQVLTMGPSPHAGLTIIGSLENGNRYYKSHNYHILIFIY